jgi:hypothetical protein
VHPRAERAASGAHVPSPFGAVPRLLVEPQQRLLGLVGVHHNVAAVPARRQRHGPVVVALVRHLLALLLAPVEPAAGLGGVRGGRRRHGEHGAVPAVARADGDHGVVEVLVRLLRQRLRRRRRRGAWARSGLLDPGCAARDRREHHAALPSGAAEGKEARGVRDGVVVVGCRAERMGGEAGMEKKRHGARCCCCRGVAVLRHCSARAGWRYLISQVAPCGAASAVGLQRRTHRGRPLDQNERDSG